MKITVITVSYNSGKTIKDTLRSVAEQDYADVEHLVIDGGSHDNTLDLVRGFGSHVARTVSERDRGLYDAMNKGLALATGDVIGFLNSDDCFEGQHALSEIAAAFEDDSIEAVYGDLVYVDQFDMSKVRRYWRSRPYQKGLCQAGWSPAHPTFYVRRDVFTRFGGFDLAFPIVADFEMALRFLELHDVKSRHLAKVLVRMRTGGTSGRDMMARYRSILEAGRACRKHGFSGGARFMARKVLSKIPQMLFRHS